jgi:energy-coupling factor transporter ATP-binding protein EcfA2
MKKLLESLNLDISLLKEKFSTLSGGEKQRCVVLQVLMLDKDIYFFDEITSGLDRKNIIKVVSLLTKSPQKTVISISHNQEWEEFCQRKWFLKKGKMLNDPVK